ncbi:MAG: ABC transporter ATP-binding protein [Acidobacteriota bacterium]|nr:ABC transporter ATP-binding protein [Acidobacteriota bacterium]
MSHLAPTSTASFGASSADSSADSPTATFEGFSYAYPAWEGRPVPALRRIEAAFGPGLTLVAGDSGSGKSTLLRALNGLVPHFHGGLVGGAATVCGMDVLRTPTRDLARSVGFVFQEPDTGFVRGTVRREVAFAAENLALDPAVIRARVADALDRAGIAALAGRRIRTLSGGERQRVALAAALAAAPDVVVLDEPLSQLDDAGATALLATLGALADEGHTVIVAEHRLAGLPGLDQVLSVSDGEVRRLAGAADVAAMDVPDAPLESAGDGRSPGVAGGAEVWSLEGAAIGIAGRALVTDAHASGAAGEVVVVTGANGAGKTTLLRTLAGIVPPVSGRVGRRPGRIAYLPQEPGLLLHRASVRAEVEQTLRWSQAEGGAEGVLEVFGLTGLADRDPRDLSVGQRQRAGLATVLAGDPRLVLLDEPTRGMDGAARRSLATALGRLTAGGSSVVLATHDHRLAADLGARTVHIADGCLRPGSAPRPAVRADTPVAGT